MNRNWNASISDLPTYIVADILSRLPAKKIIHCRCVSKTWRNLLSDPEFANLHLTRTPTTVIAHGFHTDPGPPFSLDFKLLEFEESPLDLIHYGEQKMSLDLQERFPSDAGFRVVGSANGFICLWDLAYNGAIVICNPITRELMTIPEPKYEDFDGLHIGFAFSSQTGEYKVVRIFRGRIMSEGEVYNVGTSGEWRSIGDVPHFVDGCTDGLTIKKYIHWMADDPGCPEMICSFDIDTELLQLLPNPPEFNRSGDDNSLVVLDDCLCFCDNNSPSITVIWVMKEYGVKESWTKDFVIDRTSVPFGDCSVFPLILVNNGAIMVFWSHYGILRYSCETRNWEVIQCMQDTFCLVYVASFLSMRDFGVEKVEILE